MGLQSKSIFGNRCPKCLHGEVFASTNPYKLSVMMRMNVKCGRCNESFTREPSFYFGGSKTLVSNPTGPMAVVTAQIIVTLIAQLDLPADYTADQVLAAVWPYVFIVGLFASLFLVLFGVLKLGKYIAYIPTPVISGFMSGIGIIIIISQLPKVFNYRGPMEKGALGTLKAVPDMIANTDPLTVIFALATILIIIFWKKITKAVPGQLVAVVLLTVVGVIMGINESYLIDPIPEIIPLPVDQVAILGSLGDLFGAGSKISLISLAISGLTLAVISMIDTLLTAVVADQLTKEKHNSNRELIGQGIANGISAMFGGMMGAGTTPATVLNIDSGGRTRLAALIHACFLIIVLLVAAPVASLIPSSVLAGLLIMVGISILDFEVFRQLKKIPKLDNIIMFIVLIMTPFVGLMEAVAVGLIMAALFFMKKMSDVVEKESQDTKVVRIVEQIISAFPNKDEFNEKVYIKNLTGPMFFGFASRFQDEIYYLEGKKAAVLNMSGVPYMDHSGMFTLVQAISGMKDKGMTVVLSEVRDDIKELLRGIKVIPDMVDEAHVFSSVEETIMWLNEPGHLDDSSASEGDLYIPSAYTPNGDGINDEWQLKNIEKFPQAHIVIKTREGKVIFDAVGYDVPWEGMLDGQMLPTDSYNYHIDLKGDGSDIREGTVNIFR